MEFHPETLRVDIFDAIECMTLVLGEPGADVLLCSTVFDEEVGPGDCHLLIGPRRALPSDEVLFHLAREGGAREMLFGSACSGPVGEIHGSDVRLFRDLLEATERNGMRLVEHVLVAPGGMFRLMVESLRDVLEAE